MICMSRAIAVGLAVAGLAFAGMSTAEAQKAKGGGTCIEKGGRGTAGDVEGAKFQAWEAVLQATDWGSWAGFMSSGMKIGSAPGYTVSNVRTKCGKGGIGSECVIFAKLCK